jgi:hypothetical protein
MINSKPKISIVTACLNSAQFIEKTIESVLNQNYPNLEYIIIDGGSTDGTNEIIKKYKSNLHYFISEKDLGHANALNKGFKISTGEIMGFLNGLKKLFGFGESTTEIVESSAYEAKVVEEIAIEEVPVVVEVVVEEVRQVEESVKVESEIQTEATTVKDIKSKSRRPNPNSEEHPKPTSEKTKKPYRRPRPKKNKPTE